MSSSENTTANPTPLAHRCVSFEYRRRDGEEHYPLSDSFHEVWGVDQDGTAHLLARSSVEVIARHCVAWLTMRLRGSDGSAPEGFSARQWVAPKKWVVTHADENGRDDVLEVEEGAFDGAAYCSTLEDQHASIVRQLREDRESQLLSDFCSEVASCEPLRRAYNAMCDYVEEGGTIDRSKAPIDSLLSLLDYELYERLTPTSTPVGR